MEKVRLQFVFTLLTGLLGGMFGSMLIHPTVSGAKDFISNPPVATKQLQVVSPRGVVLSEISSVDSQNSAVTFYNDEGQRMAVLGTTATADKALSNGLGGHLAIFDDLGRLRFEFYLDGNDQLPVLSFYDQHQKRRMSLGLETVKDDELPYLSFYDIFGIEQRVLSARP